MIKPADPTSATATWVESFLRHSQSAKALLAEAARGRQMSDEGRVIANRTYRFGAPSRPLHALLLPDVLVDKDGRLRLIEVNGSNGAGTSAHGGDLPRVLHQLETLKARIDSGAIDLARDPVAYVACSSDSSCQPEIYNRAALHAAVWEQELGVAARLVAPGDDPNPHGPTVVVGPIPALARHTEVRDRHLYYRDRAVVFASNANLVPELQRQHKLTHAASGRELDLGVFHEAELVPVVQDKGLQQRLCAGTGIAPLEFRDCPTPADAIRAARWLATSYEGAVIKTTGTSGGTGVVVVDAATSSDKVARHLSCELDRVAAKYGPGWMSTCLPLRVFEFAFAQPMRQHNHAYAWDARFEVLVSPHSVAITPLSARLCPAPIGSSITAESAICNLTGRDIDAGRTVSTEELIAGLGVDTTVLDQLAEALYQWTEAALDEVFGR